MKNRLLALMALCGATSSTLPLWAAWDDPVLQFTEPNLATDGTGGGVFYIYHVATQKFMAAGQPHGTRLVVADDGQEVTLSYGQDYELSRRAESDPEYSEAYGWRLSMMKAPSNGGFHELFNDAAASIWVDHNKQGHILWKIVAQDKANKVYRIKMIDEDKLYGTEANDGLYANAYMGIDEGKLEVSPSIDTSTSGHETASVDWKFVDSEVYTVYKAKKELQTQLNAADEAGFSDYAKYAEIYNKANATAEEVEEAAKALKQDIVNWKSSEATPDKPVEFTNAIANNSFADGNNGWNVVGSIGHQSGTSYETADNKYKMDHFSEKWVTSANNGNLSGNPMDISQTLENMPVGKYRLTANTIGYWQGDWQNTVPHGVYVFAENNGTEYRAEAHTIEFGGIRGTEAPAEGTPSPRNVILEFFALEGSIKIGFKTVNTNCNWVGVDNFKLEYLGLVEGGMAEELNKVITKAEELKAKYDTNQEKYSIAGEEKFTKMLQAAKDAASNPEVDDKTLGMLLTTVQTGMDTLTADVNAYKTLNQKILDLSNAWDNGVYVDLDLPDYEQFLIDLETARDGRTFNPAEVDSIQPRADRIWMSGIKKALLNGDTDNVTGIMNNPGFTGSKDGWKYDFVSGDNKFNYGYNMGEVYQTVCDVYQELEGLPNGTYEVTLQGFYRPTLNSTCASAWGLEGDTTNDILAYAFGNNTKAKLCHPFECVQDTNTVNNCEQLTAGGAELEGKWTPNGMASAAAIMEANPDAYKLSFKCYVEDDGKLRVGITIPQAGLARYWALFDNFQIKYAGADDMSGAVSTINALIAEATDLLNNEEALTTEEAKQTLGAAIEAANNAIAEGLTLETYKAQNEALNAAIKGGHDAMSAASAFETLVTEHINNFDTGVYDPYSSKAEYGKFLDLLLDEMEPALAQSLESIKWIEDATMKIDKAYATMVSTDIDFTGASINAPADVTAMIQSPSFSVPDPNDPSKELSSIKGWVTTEGNNANATGAQNYEFYVGKGDADIHQVLYALPKGYYRLVYNGFYRAGGAVEAAVAHRDSTDARNAKVYVEAGDGKWSKELASIFDHVNEYKYDGGDFALADSLFPESDKLYHFVVNNVNGTKAAFDEGLYEGNFSFYVSENGQPVTIGVSKKEVIPNDWAIFDNFRLYYYGDGDANKPGDFTSAIEDAVTDGKANVVSTAWYTINGVRVDEPKQRGIYIRQDLMSDGTKKSVKVIVK